MDAKDTTCSGLYKTGNSHEMSWIIGWNSVVFGKNKRMGEHEVMCIRSIHISSTVIQLLPFDFYRESTQELVVVWCLAFSTDPKRDSNLWINKQNQKERLHFQFTRTPSMFAIHKCFRLIYSASTRQPARLKKCLTCSHFLVVNYLSPQK